MVLLFVFPGGIAGALMALRAAGGQRDGACLTSRDCARASTASSPWAGVSFSVPRGSISAIIGPNGAGKTTLFNLITGHLRPDAGSVRFNEREVTGIAPHDLCRLGMGRSFQRTNIFPKLTVFENIQAAYLSHRGRGWNLFTPRGPAVS